MATLVVTVAWRGRRRDLAVPADVPVADLLCPLAEAMGPGPDPLPPASAGDLALAPLGGAPLPSDRTLQDCGIGDGAVLALIDRRQPGRRADHPR